jgi:hypothetical protein
MNKYIINTALRKNHLTAQSHSPMNNKTKINSNTKLLNISSKEITLEFKYSFLYKESFFLYMKKSPITIYSI